MPNLSVNISGYSNIEAESITATGRITGAGFTSSVAGSAATPSYNWSAGTNRGLFDDTNKVAVAYAGADKAYWGTVNHNYQVTQVASTLLAKGGVVQDTATEVAFKPKTTQNITGVGNSFTPNARFVPFDSDNNYTLTAAPTVVDGTYDGQLCTLINVDTGADVVTVQDQGTLANSNLRLGAATRAIGPRDSLTLVWIASLGDWVELGFNTVV